LIGLEYCPGWIFPVSNGTALPGSETIQWGTVSRFLNRTKAPGRTVRLAGLVPLFSVMVAAREVGAGAAGARAGLR
jgi:hypothetical protein